MKMKRILNRIIAVVIVMFVILISSLIIIYLAVPICRPRASVRSYVLRNIPIGTSWDDCLQILDDKEWNVKAAFELGLKINYKDMEGGLATKEYMTESVKNPNIKIVGEKSMFIYLGEYYNPLNTAVFAYFAFDGNDELVEVIIRKDIDGI